ncbi:MAG: glycosyltransferase [Eubacteriales bacterium]|nr:glycosyltransferase [Eubacteriales bacterium]
MHKILFYGNLCNLGYNFAKAVNDAGRSDLYAEFLISSQDMEMMNPSNPIWEDEEIRFHLPEWILVSREKKLRRRGPLRTVFSLIFNYRNCRMQFSKKDIVFSSTLMNIWAMLCAKKYVAMTTGSDIVELAHQKSILGKIYLNSLKKASCIGLLNTNHIDHAKQLGLDNYRFIPFAIDTAKYKPDKNKPRSDKIIILHSSALDWVESDIRPDNVKKNDIFFKGFAKFIKTVEQEIANRINVIVLEFGKDILETKELILQLGINDKIIYLPKCSKSELIDKYCKADIVVDQFAVGAFGLNALEAMAGGSIVLTYLEENNALECYGDLPPILNCRTEEDVCNALARIASNSFSELADMKKKAQDWVIKHHDYRNVVPIISDIIKRTLPINH